MRDLEAERDGLRNQVRTTHENHRQLVEAFKVLKRRMGVPKPTRGGGRIWAASG